MAPDCPRCAQRTNVQEVESSPESTWLACRSCGYVWRGPGTDAFAFIVCSRSVDARPVQELRPSGAPRAPRFQIGIPVRYRAATDEDWQAGTTENISRSGMLMRAGRRLTPRIAVEMVLTVPNAVPGGPSEDVICLGDVVRSEPVETGEAAVAVAVGDYRLRAS
jgi:hypothetical protein